MKRTYVTVIVAALVAAAAWAGCESGAEPAASTGYTGAELPDVNPLDLSPKQQGLLRREMVQLDTGMHTLHSAIVRGDGEQAAKTAQRIHDSFILKQELDEKELKALVSKLPKDFVKRDRAFHELSAELSAAAKEGDFEQAAVTYGQMSEACVGCHTEHAAERFPGLSR